MLVNQIKNSKNCKHVLLRYLISVVSFVLAIILVIEEVMDDWVDDIDK